MTKISPRHAAARRIANSYPNPLDLNRPEPCAPDTAASLRTAYDAAWDAANAAWDELPGDDTAPADEEALIAELETILARDREEDPGPQGTAIAVIDLPQGDRHGQGALQPPPGPSPLDPAVDDDAEAFSILRHVPEAARTSLAMVLDAAPRRAPRHVHRMPARETQATPAPATARPARRKRRPVLGTVAVAVVLLGGVGAAVLFLDGNGTPPSQQIAGTNIPWIRAQTGVPNSLLARPAPAAETTAGDPVAPPALVADTLAVALAPAEKADERVPQTEAVPPLTVGDARPVATQPVATDAPAVAPAEPAEVRPAGVTATTWVNMRAGAGADEAVVAVVEPGTQVDVIACENWCEVVVNGQRGFIYNEYLTGLR
ncbi:MAG: SH3 domain-containing protein [Bauldia sp.]|nr:SH3 domain-containing protein [Bauldia sp.]